MNEKCKYCDYVSKCSRKCEYDSIMCKVYRSFPKVVDKSYEQLQQENEQLKDNWNKLKEDLINGINYWQEQEKEWIKLGFIKFGGETNNKIIFKKVLNKMKELESRE